MTPRRAALVAGVITGGIAAAVSLGSFGAVLLVVALLASSWLVAGERGPSLLLILVAPLEVYRTAVPSLGVNVSIFRLVLAVAALQAVIRFAQARRFPRVHPVVATIAAVIALEWLTLYRALDPALSSRIAGQHTAGLVAAMSVMWNLRDTCPRLLVATFVGSAVIPLVIGLGSFLLQEPGSYPLPPGLGEFEVDESLQGNLQAASYSGSDIGRNKGTFPDPNQFAAFLACVLAALAASVLAVQDRRRRVRLLGGALVVAASVGTTFSRSGFIGCCIGLAIAWLAMRPRVRATVRAAAAIAAGMALVVLLILASESARQRVNPFDAATQESLSLHFETRLEAVELFFDYPVFGVGVGNFGPITGQPDLVSSTHSIYTTMLAEAGLVGIGAMLVIAWFFVREFRRRRRAPDAALMLVAVYCTLLAQNVFYEVWTNDFQWVLLGAALAACGEVNATRGRSGRRGDAVPSPTP